MLTFYDSQNKPYVLGEQIGRGGEGAVFSCEDLSVVAKIYHEPVEEEKAEKLRWMAENKDEHLLKVAAWVIDVLLDKPDGKVVGFLMPNVRAKEIHELYSLKSRRVYFPEATWHFLVHTSANVARAFYSLHKHDHVMGDVNHGNCVVLADGTVKMIDCDSYSIKTDKMRYCCDVGVATHLAPELQNADLSEIEREPNHDNFGLAVIIFQLLFLGRHPFAGIYLGAEEKSLEECIAEHRFAFGDTAELRQVRQPPGTLSLDQVSPRIAELFARAFSDENKNRPEPREWIEALEDLSENLDQCSLHPGHYFFNELAACPWCAIESQTGLMLFPFITSARDADGGKPFNIFTIENLITSLGIEQNLPAKPSKPEILPVPSPELIEIQQLNRRKQYMVIGLHISLLAFMMAVFGIGISCFIGFLLMSVFIIGLNNIDKSLRENINDRLSVLRAEWEKLESDWLTTVTPKKLTEELSLIKQRIGEYQNFQRTGELHLPEKTRYRNFKSYSRSLRLSGAKIPGVDETHIHALEYHGIKTAFDLKEESLETIPVLPKKIKTKLLEWRKQQETNFEFEKQAAEAERAKIDLADTVSENRRVIERDIERLFASLRSGATFLSRRQRELAEKSENLAGELVQAESNAEILGTSSYAVLILVLITFVMPFLGMFVGEFNSSRVTKPDYITDKSKIAPDFRNANTLPTVVTQKDSGDVNNIYVPDLTDKQIAGLTTSERQNYANALLQQAFYKMNNEAEYKEAERKLKLALRLVDDDLTILNELGKVLYKQNKYSESLKYLKHSLKIESVNYDAKIYTGINYISLKRFREAETILSEMVSEYSSTVEAFYNLGLAQKGLKDYAAAEDAFNEAIRLEPKDIESHYELGICLFRQGRIKEAQEQYRILTKLDEVRGEILREEINPE